MSLELFITYFLKKEDFLFLTVGRVRKMLIFCKRALSLLRRRNNVHTKSGIHVLELCYNLKWTTAAVGVLETWKAQIPHSAIFTVVSRRYLLGQSLKMWWWNCIKSNLFLTAKCYLLASLSSVCDKPNA